MIKSILSIIAVFFSVAAFSQTHPACASDLIHKYQMEHDSVYATAFKRQLQQWAAYNKPKGPKMAQGLLVSSPTGMVYEIPIVFHIIHTGQNIGTPQNPSDATIQTLVNYLNSVYAATWASNPDTNNGGVNVPLRFKLAQRTPSCQATNGINRVNGSSLPGYAAYGIKMAGATLGADDSLVKALSIWPSSKYVNIWIVTNIQGAAANGGAVAGYATYPGTPAYRDGVVLRYDQTDWSIAHEVGHVFGLAHTFEGSSSPTTCPTNNNCVTDGDYVCDTDPHPLVSGCPTGINPCTNSSYVPVNYNIMNYSSCPNRFTVGQRSRMIFQMLNNRGSLNTSLGAYAPGIFPTNLPSPVLACVPSAISAPGNIYGIGPQNVTLADMSYASGGYSQDGNFYMDNTANSCLTGQSIAHLQAGMQYTLTVSTGLWNDENGAAWIDWNNDGVFQTSEQVMDYSSTSGDQTATVIVPTTGVPLCTPLRMRVFSDFFGSATPTPCGNPAYGQVEDFTVYVSGTPSVSIASNAVSFCAGQVASFAATSVNGGSGATYQWQKNGVNMGANTDTLSFAPANGDTVTCVLTSSLSCVTPATVTSNTITLAVHPIVTPAIVITANPGTNLATGQNVTFTATVTNGGNAPVYEWRNNGTAIPGGTTISYTATAGVDLQNNDQISVWVHNTDSCGLSSTSNVLNIQVLSNTSVAHVDGNEDAVSIFPNPNDGSFRIKGKIEDKNSRSLSLMLFNAIGQCVYKEQTSVANGNLDQMIHLPVTISTGLYQLKIVSDHSACSLKLAVYK
ncbi:GEVED domain-containing protein [Taibaiella soli]|uniref:Ig-like domain-containing protein n=1 Tax=Taibaiella soli TaxID=1649169 RepID=A0A2W2AB83_9BACT|nr:GEVED domain-containing protein [Taibaiella soli]PZF72561.1 hypothetical protein DN068_11900 [Taibaiella soli]